MDRRLLELRHMPVRSTEGTIGLVTDVLFDDESWAVRYVVVQTTSALGSRLILVAPSALEGIDDDEGTVMLLLTPAQAATHPDIWSDMPVVLQQEEQYSRNALFFPFWGGGGSWGHLAIPFGIPDLEPAPAACTPPDRHLRSASEVHGYRVRSRDGKIGRVRDFVFDDDDWLIRHVEVQVRSLSRASRVLISSLSMRRVSWRSRSVIVSLTSAEIRASPAPGTPEKALRAYEAGLMTADPAARQNQADPGLPKTARTEDSRRSELTPRWQ